MGKEFLTSVIMANVTEPYMLYFFYPNFAEISTNILPRYNFLLIFIIPYFLVYIRFYRDYYQNDTQKFLFIKYYNSFFSCLYKFLQRLLPIYYPDNSFY